MCFQINQNDFFFSKRERVRKKIIPADRVAIKSRTEEEEAYTKKPIKANIAVSISRRRTSLCLFQLSKLNLHALSNDNKVKFSPTSHKKT